MEAKHRSEKNRILNSIRELNSYQEFNKKKIEKYKKIYLNSEFGELTIGKLNESIKQNTEKIDLLTQRLIDLDNGKLDIELSDQYNFNTDQMNKKQEFALNKKRQEKQNKINLSDRKYYTPNKNNFTERKGEYALKYYYKVCDSLPEYIIKNLENMSENKGYIWRGVYFFGKQKTNKKQPLILFQKIKGELYIRETNDTEIRIYKKKDKSKRVLIRIIKRKIFD